MSVSRVSDETRPGSEFLVEEEQLDFVPVGFPTEPFNRQHSNPVEDLMSNSRKLSIATVLLLGGVGLAIAQGTGGTGAGSEGAGGTAGGAAAGGTSGDAAAGASGTSAGAVGSQDSAGTAEQRQIPQSDARPSPGRNPNRSMSGGVAGTPGTTPMLDRPVGLPSR
jgi:hypothetical protein